MKKKTNDLSKRIPELDIARGIAVLLMILDHCMYDLWGLIPMLFPEFRGSAAVKFAKWYWNWDVRHDVRLVILFVFMALTGICCSLSKSNLKRGLKLLGVALLLTAATYVIGIVIGDPETMILFGVLHCIALALILVGLLEKFIANKWFYLAVGILLTAAGIFIGKPEYVRYSSESILRLLPETIIGLKTCGSDCFPFPLYGGQIFLGVFLGKLLYHDKKSLFPKAKYRNGPIKFIGRNSLIVYIAHQILIPVLLSVILLCCGYTLAL